MAYRQAFHILLHESAVHLYQHDSGDAPTGLPDESSSGWWILPGHLKALLKHIPSRSSVDLDREMPDGFQILRTFDTSASRMAKIVGLDAEVQGPGVLNFRVASILPGDTEPFVEEVTHCGAFTVYWGPAQP